MTIQDKYLETLEKLSDSVTISEWAIEFAKMNPDELKKANEQALSGQKINTTGIKEIAGRISSAVSTGRFNEHISIDRSERPKKVKYLTKEELDENTKKELNEDIEPLKRQEIINNAKDKMKVLEQYRMEEFSSIQKAFKSCFGVDFEIDHAQALLNKEKPGEHHPDNLQLLLKHHNGKKNNKNWERFTFEAQEQYIQQAIKLQGLVADKFDIKIDSEILRLLLLRLKEIYG